MNISLIEPYFSGSHKKWCLELAKHSKHQFSFFTLPGRYWKWRMHGGAISLAEQWNQFYSRHTLPDLILVSDMLDLCLFKSLIKTTNIPFHLYFHENQLTYPWSSSPSNLLKERDNHYGFINFSSTLCADKVWFNSHYHRNSFLSALPDFLNQFPDRKLKHQISLLEQKSAVLPLGLDLEKFDAFRSEKNLEKTSKGPILLWNHRWEYDKNPEDFFKVLFRLKEEAIPFQLVLLGANFRKKPIIFEKAKKILSNEIIHYGFSLNENDYIKWLWKSHILPVSSIQDFFGGSVVEAIYCKNLPLLPNRLAYPEHLPEKWKKKLLYSEDNGNTLYEKLKFFIENPHEITNLTEACSQYVKKYNWKSIIPLYDSLLNDK